ncbi:thiol-disulfide oxidoreductase DCC family protein [Ramlibacter pallidus]|uniref:DUF393 domain-containing protein n=1 Tax=Ramlibacter pallidus TaxID=2780087 RepID=A0ABR9S3J5_9BURK|nr:DUF393 domain-containing protein [Ramlibacter pallidus]MBE7368043.1 DUF393 domain-containing protein [Ramlibacter pallidus]
MDDPSRTTVYYNSACPVCDAGIRSERGRLQGCDIRWVDVHQQPDAVQPLGAGLEDVRKRLHVVDAQGGLHVGSDALAELMAQSPRRRPLARLLRAPGVRQLVAAGYDLFAAVLYRWNRRRGHW